MHPQHCSHVCLACETLLVATLQGPCSEAATLGNRDRPRLLALRVFAEGQTMSESSCCNCTRVVSTANASIPAVVRHSVKLRAWQKHKTFLPSFVTSQPELLRTFECSHLRPQIYPLGLLAMIKCSIQCENCAPFMPPACCLQCCWRVWRCCAC